MSESEKPKPAVAGKIRWWPGLGLVALALAALAWTRLQTEWPFQQRNLLSYKIVIIAGVALLLWWTFLSRAPKRLRLGVTFSLAGLGLLGLACFHLRGMSGDLMPIIEFRWTKHRELPLAKTNAPVPARSTDSAAPYAFPQFLGPQRNGVFPGPALATDWEKHPPQILWRQKVGAAWSGFAIAGETAITLEQRGPEECVVAYELSGGRQLWFHADTARYQTTIAGEGPRTTPTIVSNHVFTLGASGLLNCLDLETGGLLWTRNVVHDSGGKIPQWGCASSPLVANDLVIVHGGEQGRRSLHAYHLADGTPAWSAGAVNPGYASPLLAELAGATQIVAFNDSSVSAHDPLTGATLWESPWGNGNVVCSTPLLVDARHVLFSSGYGVGAELLEISRDDLGKFSAKLIWKSTRMKSKFGHLFARDGFLYGLDDGIFACVDLKDGSQRWKEGRYGHGQGLLVGGLYLLMSEAGELLLLKPTPTTPQPLARFPVFTSKTWNPLALADDLLLTRNDQEAVCLRLALAP
ncbi:MAG: hypothetical protein EPO07_02935 [Verrucomicrobia bacterium]|nr:MAG: hypothetical protein EPO07_02935 [Verrucomicrobiota bacterium]